MRKFGIELELVAPRAATNPIEHAEQVMRSAGVEARTSTHFGRAYDRWQAKPDGSLQPYGRCVEVVSRIMPANETSYEEVARVVNALDAAGYGVNRTCGFHVHVNVADLTLQQRLLVALRYAILTNEINAMVPPSRRANNYCRSLDASQRTTLATQIAAAAPAVPGFGRYLATNLAWVAQEGGVARIEFRQAGGTCNVDKVVGWVRFLQDLISEVVRRSNGVDFRRRLVEEAAPAPVTTTAPGRAPRMRPGSHVDLVLTQLRTTGSVTTSWAGATHQIAPHVLRSIISGLRRHGAAIETSGNGADLQYNLPPSLQDLLRLGARVNDSDIFRATVTVSPAATPRVRNAAPAPADLMTYDLFAGLSETTAAWVRQRRAVFAEDMDTAA